MALIALGLTLIHSLAICPMKTKLAALNILLTVDYKHWARASYGLGHRICPSMS